MPRLPSPLRELWLARLLARSQRGDRAAFQRLYRALHGPVSSYVGRRIRRREDAEDVVGQVFFKLLEELDRVDPRKGSAFAYVMGMARNAVADHARGRLAQAPEEVLASLPDAAAGPDERLQAAREEELVRRELAALPPATRELLVLRYGDELRCAEIAQILGLSEGAVRQRLSRAVRELRARWNPAEQKGAVAHEG